MKTAFCKKNRVYLSAFAILMLFEKFTSAQDTCFWEWSGTKFMLGENNIDMHVDYLEVFYEIQI